MNEEKMRHEIQRAMEMAEAIHDGMVENLVDADVDSAVKGYATGAVLGLATLKWYLEHISEGVRS